MKLPLLNAMNFAIIFGILSYLNIITNNIILTIAATLLIGFIVSLFFELLFFKKQKSQTIVQEKISDFSKKRVNGSSLTTNKKISKKPLIITSILVLLITISALYLTGHIPLNIVGQTIKEETIQEEVIEDVFDINDIINLSISEIYSVVLDKYAGRCEKESLMRIYNERAEAYTYEEVWVGTGHACNNNQDCYDTFNLFEINFTEDKVQCNLEN